MSALKADTRAGLFAALALLSGCASAPELTPPPPPIAVACEQPWEASAADAKAHGWTVVTLDAKSAAMLVRGVNRIQKSQFHPEAVYAAHKKGASVVMVVFVTAGCIEAGGPVPAEIFAALIGQDA